MAMYRGFSSRARLILHLFLLIDVLVLWLLSSGCYTIQSIALEARCGIGKDYACISRWFEAGDPNNPSDNELRMVCGCVDKENLKGN